MNLAEVRAQFTGLINRRDLSSNTTLANTFINMAIMRIQRELRGPALEKIVQVTITSPYTVLVIPSDFLELISIIPDKSNAALTKCDISKARALAQTVGCPEFYARQGGQWILGPAPAAGDVIDLTYYAELTPLVLDSDTNVISLVAWDLIVYGALSAAGDYYRDNKTPDWEARYTQILKALQDQGDEDEFSGGSAVMPAYIYPDDC